jgi:hypothetical protein
MDSNTFDPPHDKDVKTSSTEIAPEYPGPLALSFITMALSLSVFLVAL